MHNELIENLYGKKLVDSVSLFRDIALEIDKNPENIAKYKTNVLIANLSNDRDSSCYDRTFLYEALSYGDAGVLLASPGPSLAGLMLRELGNEWQKNLFFAYVEQKLSSTFLAVTEPKVGSDAANMKARLIKQANGSYSLTAEKWLVGHGADADIGVLVAKVTDGPLGMMAILLTPEVFALNKNNNTCYRHHLDTFGLKGARLSRLVFNNFVIPQEFILGSHLNLVDRGLRALIKTFNRMRPCVASFALGQAQAVVNYIKINCYEDLSVDQIERFQYFDIQLAIIRDFLYKAAAEIDNNPIETSLVSLAKVNATTIGELIIRESWKALGLAMLKHPLLLKWSRDVYGYEYMEGTANMHYKNVYQGYLRKAFINL